MTETFYEIINTFLLGFFSTTIQTDYADFLELLSFILTLAFIYLFLLRPLYRLAMIIMPRRGR